MSALTQYDSWLADDGPAALVIREHLIPVEGPDAVFFPAGFAPEEGADRDKSKFQGGYNIDPRPPSPNGQNVCLVDSVGSQANRIEPLFAKEKYKRLIPQVVITAGEKQISLLEAGHRAGDFVVRSTAVQAELHKAFKAVQAGNAEPLAKIAPTSLVFGVWDSRNTQAKLPRLMASTIRAYNVRPLTRSAQYNPAAEYEKENLLPPPAELKLTEKKYGERGASHVPAPATHGGVIADGGIRRDATLSLAALRLLRAGTDEAKTLALRRYILGLSLVALTATASTYLRQGCNLVPDVENPRQFILVHGDGRRDPAAVTHDAALAFASEAAVAFGVGEDKTVAFDKELAKKDVTGEGDAEKSKTAKTKAAKEKQ
ncbi:MAG TPA: type I-U CRISPR-associated RAMP protein Csb1/Cas7u [Gemmataceae bacterium]|nr:type I-U CRISPR-associated RAMP protein Csb1/Cas7u [Gemmataceae bacterium]